MTNTREHTPEEQRRQFKHELNSPTLARTGNETDHRHYAPIQLALPNEATGLRMEAGDWRLDGQLIGRIL